MAAVSRASAYSFSASWSGPLAARDGYGAQRLLGPAQLGGGLVGQAGGHVGLLAVDGPDRASAGLDRLPAGGQGHLPGA